MSGRFEGLTDGQWNILQPLMPQEPQQRLKGKPHTPWRKVCNTLFWILITGSRWVDVPIGDKWGSRTASHRWLGIWQEDGRLQKILQALRDMANLHQQINWDRLAADGFFSAGKGGGELVDYGYKGKGVTTHLLVDGEGKPIAFETTSAKGDEKKTDRASHQSSEQPAHFV